MAQLQLKSLLGRMNALLEKSYGFLGFALIKKSDMEQLVEEIANCIPADIKEAELIISRKEEIVQKAQNRAEIIIQEATNEQARLVSDNEILRKAQEVITSQKEQVEQYCENIQNTAIKEAENIKITAIREAATIQHGAEDYAERLFNTLEASITQALNNVQTCQKALSERRQKQTGSQEKETTATEEE